VLELISKVWKVLPRGTRAFLTRRVQSHFTVSAAAVVFNEKGEILLLDHYLRPSSGWGIPGGFIDRGEQAEDAVRRELKEETAIALAEVRLYRARTFGRHMELTFTARGIGEPHVTSREIRQLAWFSLDALPPEMSVDQQFLIRAAAEFDAARRQLES
jgi:ADP-ribose pyrophosphatase YjhB (NUDIX family)